MQPCLYSGNPILKQPGIQEAQVAGKNIVHCLMQKIAFAWVKTGRKLRLEKVVLLRGQSSKGHLFEMKGKT